MIETDLKEAKKGVLEIPCCGTVGHNLLRFIYTGELDIKVLETEVEVFLKLGHLFDIDNLKELQLSLKRLFLAMKMRPQHRLLGRMLRASPEPALCWAWTTATTRLRVRIRRPATPKESYRAVSHRTNQPSTVESVTMKAAFTRISRIFPNQTCAISATVVLAM